MARVVLALFALFMLLTVLRGLRIFWRAFSVRPGSAAGRRGAARGAREAEMVRDPVCGTWVDRSLALPARRGGETIAVCSEGCRKSLEAAG